MAGSNPAAPDSTPQEAKPDAAAPEMVTVRVQQLNSITPLQFQGAYQDDSKDDKGKPVQVERLVLVTGDGVEVPSGVADALIASAASVGVVVTRDDAEEAK